MEEQIPKSKKYVEIGKSENKGDEESKRTPVISSNKSSKRKM